MTLLLWTLTSFGIVFKTIVTRCKLYENFIFCVFSTDSLVKYYHSLSAVCAIEIDLNFTLSSLPLSVSSQLCLLLPMDWFDRYFLLRYPFTRVESRLYWIHDPTPSPPRRMEHTTTVPPSDSSAPISSKSSVSIPSGNRVPIASDSVCSPDKSVSVRDKSENEASAIAMHSSTGAPLTPSLPKKYRRRRRRQARRADNRNSAASLAAPMTPDERWANQRAAGHAGATQPQLEGSDPTSSKRTAVYPPSRIVGNPAANENLPFQLGLESSRFPGLYKPAVPDQQQDMTTRTL